MTLIMMSNAHGTFTTTGMGLDLEIASRLPNSPECLRGALATHTGLPRETYADVHTVTELLIMFADTEYPGLDRP